MNNKSAIGLHVKYFDYLGLERFGRIIYIEPSNMYSNIYETDIYYVYIEDEEVEFNTHDIIINNEIKMYAEIRLSTEVYIDEKK